MMLRPCPHEKEIAALVQRGQWPDASPAELRAHVESCRTCGDFVMLAQAFRSARTEAMAAANPGSAGVVWWRAQLRRRKAAMEKIGKPVLGAQIFALSVTLVIAVVFIASQARQQSTLIGWFSQLPHSFTGYLGSLWSSASSMPSWGLLLAVCGLAAVALLSGVMLYVDRQRR